MFSVRFFVFPTRLYWLLAMLVLPAVVRADVPAGDALPYPESFFTAVDGVRVHARRLGTFETDRIPILLVHGLGGSSAVWDDVAYRLAEEYPVLLIDLKGFGYTDAPQDGAYQITRQAMLIRDWLDANGIDKVTLVGQSMGAYTSHWFAMQYPERLASVLLLAGAVVAEPPARNRMQRWVLSWTMDRRLQKFVDMVFGRWAVMQMYNKTIVNLDLLTDERMEKIYAPYRQDGRTHALLSALYQLMVKRPAELDTPQRLQVPVMMGWGDNDRVAPIEIGDAARAFDPAIEFQLITNAGHNTMWDQPQQVINLIKRTYAKGT